MKKLYTRIFSMILILAMLVCSSIPAFAAEVEEEYLSDLRIIYADNYSEAKEALEGTDFEDYEVFNYNLNSETGKTGVWLAYKTTTNIEDAITDISIMQMDGGYKEGNYQAMIEESRGEYEKMGENYALAIDYFVNAYEEGDFLAKLAYRQLNFYTSITDESLGIEIPDFDGELLGDVFHDGISATELATIFMEGNSYALDNIRSLLAMGVSYNRHGRHYLQNVEEAVSIFENDEEEFEYHDYYDDFDDLALVISGTINTFREMFEELAAYESEMNFYDEDVTELELKYLEIKSIADRFREVDYLEGETLYDFCMYFEYDEDDLTSLYPLVWALNEGQIAMVKVSHYHDVVRYSMTDYPEEELIAEIEKIEEIYKENPFNVYTGVDRSIYYGTFALTSDAYRSDAYTGEGLLSHLFVNNLDLTLSSLTSGLVSVFFGAWAVSRTMDAIEANVDLTAAKIACKKMASLYNNVDSAVNSAIASTPTSTLGIASTYGNTCGDAINTLYLKLVNAINAESGLTFAPTQATGTISARITYLNRFAEGKTLSGKSYLSSADIETYRQITDQIHQSKDAILNDVSSSNARMESFVASNSISKLSLFGTGVLYAVSAAFMLYTAYNLGHTVWSYYHPDYKDIPTALVDLIETVDGDRYIKYDVAFNAETNDDGVYEAADLNAFGGQRWNALYYTKSYEAGKPLLADTFTASASNSTPKEGYTPVHRFGEIVCYNLNKYTYGFTPSIYLSVKQSKNDKSAVADVPQVIGSVFNAGYLFLAGGVGTLVGVGGTVGTVEVLKRKKNKKDIAASKEGQE